MQSTIPFTRADIAALLKSIGAPGKNRDKKLQAVKDLELKNNQGHAVELTLETYSEF